MLHPRLPEPRLVQSAPAWSKPAGETPTLEIFARDVSPERVAGKIRLRGEFGAAGRPALAFRRIGR